MALVLAIGCGDSTQGADGRLADRQGQETAAIARESLQQVMDQIPAFVGTFEGGSTGQLVFRGDDTRIVRKLGAHEDSAVTALVECLDRTDSSAMTLPGGRRALVGAVCGYFLFRVAYPLEFEDGGDGRWPGFVYPNADAEHLKRAKLAWKSVLRQKRYRLS